MSSLGLLTKQLRDVSVSLHQEVLNDQVPAMGVHRNESANTRGIVYRELKATINQMKNMLLRS